LDRRAATRGDQSLIVARSDKHLPKLHTQRPKNLKNEDDSWGCRCGAINIGSECKRILIDKQREAQRLELYQAAERKRNEKRILQISSWQRGSEEEE
jgi:hypothetical protein